MHDFYAIAKELDLIAIEDSDKQSKSLIDNKLLGFQDLANNFLSSALNSLFPIIGAKIQDTREELSKLSESLSKLLIIQQLNVDIISQKFIAFLPELKRTLIGDAKAILDGDPAAKSLDEVMLCYPGFYAICVHRIAHQLETLGVALLSRFLSETAHRKTGIDIHPGARIGSRFCIDHGTGIVIGETTIIGDDVKLYHGVTLGGLSVLKSLASKKRHPTIENDVVIYSNAVILGGETTIGHHSIIGGNVWLPHSVDPYSVVEQEKQQLSIRTRKSHES